MTDLTVIAQAVAELKSGNVIALPTETIYGLAVDALNPAAVKKIYHLKHRPAQQPLAIAIAHPRDSAPWVTAIGPDAQALMTAFWPGPLTIVFAATALAATINPGVATIGLRCSACPIPQYLITQLGRPLALTSANISGHPAALTAAQVTSDFPDIMTISGDEYITGAASTIIDISHYPYRILRQGAVSIAAIQAVITLT